MKKETLINKKWHSNSGASLALALLLFLVCVIIGSIVITAGTVASGRLADKAKNDQRYYRVTSAAELLKNKLDKKEVVIERKKDKDGNYSISYNNMDRKDFLTARAIELLGSTSGEAMWNADFYTFTESESEYTLNFVDKSSTNRFSADIKTRTHDGIVDMLVTSENYTLLMTLTPEVSEVKSTVENEETKTATITWHVSNIEKVVSAACAVGETCE